MHTIKQCFQLELTWFFMELVHCVPYVTAALQRLDLSNNRLPKLPDTFGKLSSLTKLDRNNNRLVAIPARRR